MKTADNMPPQEHTPSIKNTEHWFKLTIPFDIFDRLKKRKKEDKLSDKGNDDSSDNINN